jgi:hypothetical protein
VQFTHNKLQNESDEFDVSVASSLAQSVNQIGLNKNTKKIVSR